MLNRFAVRFVFKLKIKEPCLVDSRFVFVQNPRLNTMLVVLGEAPEKKNHNVWIDSWFSFKPKINQPCLAEFLFVKT